MMSRVILSCALTGVLTDPAQHPVPVTPQEMAREARRAHDAGAAVMHLHYRRQEPGLGRLPSWDPDLAAAIVDAIRAEIPGVIINSTTGVVGADISGPAQVLRRVKPEVAALNAGSLNYLKTRSGGQWAWPPMLFDNPVEKIEAFIKIMRETNTLPECECFDLGIVRSIALFQEVGLLGPRAQVSLVMGVASGMPARADLLPILIDELPPGAHWQTIGIGRAEVWALHRRTAALGGHLRTGVEDTFYLPSGEKVTGNGPLIEAMAALARDVGREPASIAEARALLGLPDVAP
jgi:3-keto-5-aminohexanoate cleavage enzyme